MKRLIQQNLPKIDELKGSSANDVTFFNSKTIPFQRWYPYIEGYSPDFVKALIVNYELKDGLIYDPFCGTGTTIFAADSQHINTVFSEVNPLLQFIIQTKIKVLKAPIKRRKELSKAIENIGNQLFKKIELLEEDEGLKKNYGLFKSKKAYFSTTTFSKLLKLRTYLDRVQLEDELLSELLTMAVLPCLLQVSYLKKAGDVRFKTPKEINKELKTLKEVLPKKLFEIAEDVGNIELKLQTKPEFILTNAKNIHKVNDLSITNVITSPPYLNGTNYFRNTKLELWFLRYIQSQQDLRIFRDQALTSGINDVRKKTKELDVDILTKSDLLKETVLALQEHAYDSRIPLMTVNYFEEMFLIFKGLRSSLQKDTMLFIDIGDSIFAGVHIQTDEILIEILTKLGYNLVDRKILRKRRSRNQQVLIQALIVLKYEGRKEDTKKEYEKEKDKYWQANWKIFKQQLPHQTLPYSKRNWGHPNHSICSYQGKLKPAIAHHLVKTFVPENGTVLDPFSGVGTIPFEAALAGKKAFAMDLSATAYFISSAKLILPNSTSCQQFMADLQHFIVNQTVTIEELEEVNNFGFNKKIVDYYEKQSLKEIILARRYFKNKKITDPNEMLVLACLLHILHGNRPYALSRRSHPIVPYAPKGEFEYKSLIIKLKEKVGRTINADYPLQFQSGKVYHQDCTKVWPQEINNLDAIITSPPFFDSTRFYLANWLRLWFTGWSENDFKNRIGAFIEEKQKISFDSYQPIFRQAKERLKDDGVCVLHLGKSKKCNMAEELKKVSKRWFKTADLFDESVAHCESHGIRDKGTVTTHQYLILQ